MRTLSIVLALCAAVAMAAPADEAKDPLRAVSTSTGLFSTRFFKEISKAKPSQNLISSPLSADLVLSMTAYGAAGKTAEQMREALSLPPNDLEARQGFQSLLEKINKVENVTLEVANKMYLAKGLELKAEYKGLTKDNFYSEASELDVAQPTKAAADVNGWVVEKTHGKIDKILKEEDIDGSLRMVLLNAVYFKGNWAKKFKTEDTKERTFHVDEKTKKEVPTMHVSGNFQYGELPELKAKFIELPYSNENLKMVIVVPDEVNGLNYVLENLESVNSTNLAKNGYSREVQLYLPKFKIESEIDLKEPLQKMGMIDMFENSADFSGISKEPLKVGKVLQKAFIEVNEEGSEAAAVTASGIVLFSLPPIPIDFNVDRPFYYEIVKQANNSDDQRITLFSGLVRTL